MLLCDATLAASIHRVATKPGQAASGAGVCWAAGMPWPAPVLGRRSARCGLRVDRDGLGSGGLCAPSVNVTRRGIRPRMTHSTGRSGKPSAGEAGSRFQLDHARGDLDQARRKASNCATRRRAFGHQRAQAPEQDIGAGRQEEAELVGAGLGAGRPIGGKCLPAFMWFSAAPRWQ